jgi:membrane protease YdiL (CAAX protease family)
MAMKTPIGHELLRSPRAARIAALAAIVAILADFALVLHGDATEISRGLIPLVCLIAYLHLASGDLSSIGLSLRPAQPWRYWVLATIIIGAIVAVLIAVGIAICRIAGWQLPIHTTPPDHIPGALFYSCIAFPIVEEATYRIVICVPTVVILRPAGAILVSGALFAALHFAYGNASPDNFVAGFFLAWAFLKSGTIVVPVLLHSLGNAFAVAAQVAAWYWLNGGR